MKLGVKMSNGTKETNEDERGKVDGIWEGTYLHIWKCPKEAWCLTQYTLSIVMNNTSAENPILRIVALTENPPLSGLSQQGHSGGSRQERTPCEPSTTCMTVTAEICKLAYTMLEIRLTGRTVPLRTSMVESRNEISTYLGYYDKMS